MRKKLDVSAYLVLGPENTGRRQVADVVRDAVANGFSCVQLRSKTASAREMIALARETAEVLKALNKSDEVALLIDDRLDVVLAAREQGVKVDGIHVGQKDIPVSICRKYLGDRAVIGLSAPTVQLLSVLESEDMRYIDYLGAAPYHETMTKTDLERDTDGTIITQTDDLLKKLTQKSPLPVVVGGGVKLSDVPAIKRTGAAGFFVITAITDAVDVKIAAKEMSEAWKRA